MRLLYDRKKTAVTGEDEASHIVYNRILLALAQHYWVLPRACRPYRAKSKGKVERPFSYIRLHFFLTRSLRNLDDLNRQLRTWLDAVANVRLHGTTQRIVSEAFAAQRSELQPLPAQPFDALLKLSGASATTASSRSVATTTACRIGAGASSRCISYPT